MADKKYISHLGYDYTPYVKTDDDIADFHALCDAERLSDGVPLSKCVHHVAKALNLDAKLRGRKRKVLVQGNFKNN